MSSNFVRNYNIRKWIKFFVFLFLLYFICFDFYGLIQPTKFKNFNTNVVVNEDGTSTVNLDFDVFARRKVKNGITVALPSYRGNDTGIVDIEVVSGNNKLSATEKYGEGGQLILYIYSPLSVFESKNYRLSYKVTKPLVVPIIENAKSTDIDNEQNIYGSQVWFNVGLIGFNNMTQINNYNYTLTMPSKIQESNVSKRFGVKTKVNDNQVTYHVNKIRPGNDFTVNVLASSDGFNISPAEKDFLIPMDYIPTNEEELDTMYSDANNGVYSAYNIGGFTLFIIGTIILIIFKGRSISSKESNLIVTQPPSNLDPICVNLLIEGMVKLNEGDSAIILLTLFNKGVIDIKLFDDENQSYIEFKNNEITLQAHEKGLLQAIYNSKYKDIQIGQRLYLHQIKDNINESKGTKKFSSFIHGTRKLIGKMKNYIIVPRSYRLNSGSTINTIFSSIGIIFMTVFWFFLTYFLLVDLLGFFMPLIWLPLIILFTFYFQLFSLYTKKGRQEFIKWMAFKHYLEEYTFIKDKSIDSISAWREYLLYAIALKVNKDVIRALGTVYQELDTSQFNDQEVNDYANCVYYFDYSLGNYAKDLDSNPLVYSTSSGVASSSSGGSSFGGSGFSSSGGGGFGSSGGGVGSW